MEMKKILILAIAIIGFTGCTGDEASAGDGGNEYNVNSGGGDVTINDTTVTDGGTYVNNADGTVTYVSGNSNTITLPNGEIVEVGDDPSGVYDPDYTQEECAAEGYFWCTLANQCMNSPADGSSCTL